MVANPGNFAEILGMSDDAMQAYEHALRANPQSVPAMMGLSVILKKREDFAKSAEYLQAVLKIEPTNGEAWGSLGHCFLMMDDLSQAYAAYQSALMNLRDVKDPKLWYGIGILYDRYGSLEHAEEAFSQVMRMQPDFEKASEVYFRLGIIYKQQQKFGQSLEVSTSCAHAHLVDDYRMLTVPYSAVLQIHCPVSAKSIDGRRHLVPDWPCLRAAERCKWNPRHNKKNK